MNILSVQCKVGNCHRLFMEFREKESCRKGTEEEEDKKLSLSCTDRAFKKGFSLNLKGEFFFGCDAPIKIDGNFFSNPQNNKA